MKNKLLKRIVFIFPSMLLLLSIVLLILGIINCLFAIIGLSILLFITIIEWLFVLMFEEGSLDIHTPDGSNEPLHPSVYYMGADGWNGYQYWMAFTPYPIHSKIYRDRFECPCIVVSNDGLKWIEIGNGRYLDDLTEVQIINMDYFSDPELVFDKSQNLLYLYYRLSTGKTSSKKVIIYRISTKDGVEWSKREPVVFNMCDCTKTVICPTILIKDNKYYLWFVSGEKWHRKVYRMCSDDGMNWTNLIECQLCNYTFDPWHIDCKYVGNMFILTIYDMTENITVLLSGNGIDFEYCKVVIKPSGSMYSFYRSTLYRPSLCFSGEYKLFFSAGNDRRNSIGLMTGDSIESLKVKYIPIGVYRLKDIFMGWYEKYLFPFVIIFKKVKGLLCQN